MKNWLKNNWLFLILIAFGVGFYFASKYLFESKSLWDKELSKSLFGLASTTIVGGFLKWIFDENQKNVAKAKEKKEFKIDILNRLRKVFDAVDSSRLLIEAHKSAKTYSEKIQENIIPSIVTLYDIKRSLVDSKDKIEDEKLQQLRLSIHYMIAYLQAMAEEYKVNYPTISHKQFLYEKVKEKAGEDFVTKLLSEYPDNYFSIEALTAYEKNIKYSPKWVWESISKLKQMGLFIEDSYESPYRKMFVDFYEYAKKILKDTDIETITRPDWYNDKSLNKMKEIDKENEKIKEDDSNEKTNEMKQIDNSNKKSGGSLVEYLMKEYLKISEKLPIETKSN